jgi:hypothetical protein
MRTWHNISKSLIAGYLFHFKQVGDVAVEVVHQSLSSASAYSV